jgi:DNA repair protein RecO (recombination protein O)
MALVKTEGLVIKKFDYGETSLIAHFYTKDFGKVNLIFKGIKETPHKFSSSLEPFSLNDMIFYKKRNSTLHLASSCDLKENFDSIRNDLNKFSSATLVIELLDKVVPLEEPNQEIFNLTLDCLRKLVDYPYPDKINTIFKIKLLTLAGFKPHIDSCISCQDKITASQVKFSINLGGLLCPKCQKKDLKARLLYRGTVITLLHIERNDLDNNLRLGINPQIKRELDYILDAFLEFHLEKRLKSQKVILELLK